MRRGVWQEQPGAGEAALQSIAEDVQRRNALSAALGNLSQRASEGVFRPAVVLNAMVQESVAARLWAEPNTSAIDELSEHEAGIALIYALRNGLAKTLLQGSAGSGIGRLLHEANYGRSIHQNALSGYSLRVLHSGVVRYRRTGIVLPPNPYPTADDETSRLLESGEEFNGRLRSIQAFPTVGGSLHGSKTGFWSLKTDEFAGLVSPQSGEPQVELALLTMDRT